LGLAVLKAILLKPTPRNDWPLAAPGICVHVDPEFGERRIPSSYQYDVARAARRDWLQGDGSDRKRRLIVNQGLPNDG
jgi:hypothetical protein